MKKCTILSNCQSKLIARYLETHPEFSRTYDVEVIALDYNIFMLPLDEDAKSRLRETDVFIYVPITSDSPLLHGRVSNKILTQEQANEYLTDNIINDLIPIDAIKIAIPNLHFEGYHPFYIRNSRFQDTIGEEHEHGVFPYGNKIINERIKDYSKLSQKSLLTILRSLNDQRLMSESSMQSHFKKSLRFIKHKESQCDIKISDLIVDKFVSNWLFYTPDHPSRLILNHVCNQIFKIIGLSPIEFEERLDLFSNHQLPISPCVQKFFGLKFINKDQLYRYDALKGYFTHDEYWLKYILTVYPELISL